MISSQIQKRYFQRYLKKRLFEALNQNKEFEDYRNKIENEITDAYVAFVDVANFSSRINGWSVDEVKEYLDGYYQVIVPIIHKYHGQIDKIMGDGIVIIFSNVFGFVYSDGAGSACLSFCKECIKSLEDTCYEVKAAIASGSVYFCKTGVEEIYEEISCIGHPMTVAFRLENEASANQIWMLASDPVVSSAEIDEYWMGRVEEVFLKGLDETKAFMYEYNSVVGGACKWMK